MKALEVYLALAKVALGDDVELNSITRSQNLFDLKFDLLDYKSGLVQSCPMYKRLDRIIKDITIFKCYYSELEECLLANNGDSKLAENMLSELNEWYQQNANNQNIGSLKSFAQSQISKHLVPSAWSFWSSQAPVLQTRLESILDEIPATDDYVKEGRIFNEIRQLLNDHFEKDSAWTESIKNILSSFNAQLDSEKPWMEIKQTLRQACAEQLTPSRLSFYSAPEVKDKLLQLLENIPSERYAKMYSHDLKQGLGRLLEVVPEAEVKNEFQAQSKTLLTAKKRKKADSAGEASRKSYESSSGREKPRTEKKHLNFKWG